jgi:hypothetical protein
VEDEAGIKVPVFSKAEGHFHVRQPRHKFGLGMLHFSQVRYVTLAVRKLKIKCLFVIECELIL